MALPCGGVPFSVTFSRVQFSALDEDNTVSAAAARGKGQWAMGKGQRAKGNGQWAMGKGHRHRAEAKSQAHLDMPNV